MTEVAFVREALKDYGLLAGDVTPVRTGHINATWRCRCGGSTYIFQKLSAAQFGGRSDILKRNYEIYVKACLSTDVFEWFYPQWLRNGNGEFFLKKEDGSFCRVYEEIPGDITESILDPSGLGTGLGRLHSILDIAVKPESCAIPGYRDFNCYYEKYLGVINDLKEKGAKIRDDDLERAIDVRFSFYRDLSFRGDQVVHGDTKQSNAIWRAGSIIAWIDLDTLMLGSRLIDVADTLRSILYNQHLSSIDLKDILNAFFRAYQTAGGRVVPEDQERVGEAVSFLCYQLGIRYYTRFLSMPEDEDAKDRNVYLRKARANIADAEKWLSIFA